MGTTKLTKLTNKSKRYESSATEVNPLRQNSQRLSQYSKCGSGAGAVEVVAGWRRGSGSRRVSRTDAWGAKKLTELRATCKKSHRRSNGSSQS